MIYTPLRPGQILRVDMDAVVKASHLRTPRLRAGFSVQFAHDAAFVRAGIQMTAAPDEMSPFDRQIGDQLQDDKLATFFTEDGLVETQRAELSRSHSVQWSEYLRWNINLKEEIDTAIHGFELTKHFSDGEEFDVIYRGAISWLRVRPYTTSRSPGSFFFDREQAYKYSLM